MYTVYILKSERDGGYYIGSTSDVHRRLIEHNRGWSRSTKPRRPWIPVYREECATISEAKRREKILKAKKSSISIERLLTRS